MSDKDKIVRLRRELIHSKTCYYGGHKCSHPEARARRDVERMLDEKITPHEGLDADEKWHRDNSTYCWGE